MNANTISDTDSLQHCEQWINLDQSLPISWEEAWHRKSGQMLGRWLQLILKYYCIVNRKNPCLLLKGQPTPSNTS